MDVSKPIQPTALFQRDGVWDQMSVRKDLATDDS